jgi:hypothetical protein
MTQYNFNAPWHRLHHCVVGKSYAPEFYQDIKDSRIRNCLQKIAHETEEDYKNLATVLQSLGVTVDRPNIDVTASIMDYVDHNTGCIDYTMAKSFTLIPRPPMQPRDSVLIVGDQVLPTLAESQWFGHTVMPQHREFDAPLVTVIGQHLIVDCREQAWLADYVQQQFPDRTVVPVHIGGHNDAVFCPVRPGLIVSTYHHDNYAETFPGWEVKYIENQSWNAIPDWRSFKHSNVNKWWTPEKSTNPEFANFVDTWLSNWMGYVEETVFDVNMLQIDEHTVLVNNYNQDMFDFFKTKNIEPIVTPFRHRFFWDGGIHCITADLYRQGESDVYLAQ